METSCSTITIVALSSLLAIAPARALATGFRTSGWCEPVKLEGVSSPVNDFGPEISDDDRELYFGSNRVDARGDLFVARRERPNHEWELPIALSTVNGSRSDGTAAIENAPALSRRAAHVDGGHVDRLFFSSDRFDPEGPRVEGRDCSRIAARLPDSSCDVWYSERVSTRDGDGAWTEPRRLGGPINTEHVEFMGDVFEDEEAGVTELYFTSNRRQPDRTDQDVYVVHYDASGTLLLGPELVPQVSTDGSSEERVAISADGRTMLFQSNRAGGLGSFDLWYSMRRSTRQAWDEPVNVGATVNSVLFDGGPRLSSDGQALYFFSGVAGNVDLFMSVRESADGCPNPPAGGG
jgi:hypothetical protein